MAERLTAIQVRNAKKPGRYSDGNGLMIHVRKGGSRQWILRIVIDGKRRDIGLGSVDEVPLAKARQLRDAMRAMNAAGSDPLAAKMAERHAKRQIPLFADAARRAHDELSGGWKNLKHREQWLSTLERFAFPIIGEVRIDRLDLSQVRDVLLPIWLDRPETARRVRQRVIAVVDWAAGKGYRGSLDTAPLGKSLPKQPKQRGHFAAMPYSDVPAFMARLAAMPASVGRLALQFTILTAARSGEVRGATWQEIDLGARLWRIPAERMKAGAAHDVPISDAAMAILRTMLDLQVLGGSNGLIFGGLRGKPLSDMTLTKAMRDLGETATVHGFRSAFKDWAVESTSFADAVSEAALAHTDTNKVRAAYRRTDFLELRRELMATWGNYLAGHDYNVVPLPKRTSDQSQR